MLLAFLVALALSATAVFRLREHAREASRNTARLAQIQVAINRLGALRWQALAEGRLDGSLAGSLAETRQRADRLLGELRASIVRGNVLPPVEARYAQYLEVMNPLLRLIAAGGSEAARALQPGVESRQASLSRSLGDASAFHERESEASAGSARLGSFAILFAAGLGAALLFREREITNRRSRVALAEAAARRQSARNGSRLSSRTPSMPS
jgi:hypothetical protein